MFIKDFCINNSNPEFFCVVGLNAKKGFDSSILSRYINAVCNGGGGVIVIGAENTQGILKATGIRFKTK